MKKLSLFILLATLLVLGGCVVRTYTVEKPRTDLEIEGNRGYIMGAPKEEVTASSSKKTRTITVIEIELNPPGIKEEAASSVKEKEEEKLPSEREEEIFPQALFKEEFEEGEEKKVEEQEKKYTLYTIQSKDTLQKISRRFYGTTKKWPLIYQENKDKITDPDKIQPGVTIRIPVIK